MKKILYLTFTLSYAVIGLVGATGNAYMETKANQKLMSSYGLWLLLVAALTGILTAYFFPKVFPKGFAIQRKAGKILIIVVLVALFFPLTIGVFKFVNAHAGKQELFTIDGRITNKWIKAGAKRTKIYYLKLRDNASGGDFEFKVKRKVYEELGFMGSSFKKDFYRGSLGIVYRHRY
ncbi:MAG: hypothetical protein ABIT05_10255 [Chitinophagaceae bacterium]